MNAENQAATKRDLIRWINQTNEERFDKQEAITWVECLYNDAQREEKEAVVVWMVDGQELTKLCSYDLLEAFRKSIDVDSGYDTDLSSESMYAQVLHAEILRRMTK
jgi:hypothetical protein